MIDPYEFFRDEESDQSHLARTEAILRHHGWTPADDPYSSASAALFLRSLRDQVQPDFATLILSARKLIERDSPFLPDDTQLWDDPSRIVVHDPAPQLIWVDPLRIFRNREYKDKGDWTRNRDKPLKVRNNPVQGLAEFAQRIARERGDVRGLAELLGPVGEVAHVDLDGWETPLGAFFRVSVNGNHRAAAFAALNTPCIPATVHWNSGPFSASTSNDSAADEALCSYRSLLHCYGVASYPDPEDIGTFADQIVSDWPFLIDSAESAVRSLALLEQVAGTQYDGQIGRLPRGLFNDADKLISAGRRTQKVLKRNRRRIETGGLHGFPQGVSFFR